MVPLGCRDGCKVHNSLTQHGCKLGLAGSPGRAVCWGPWLSTGSEKPYLKPKQVTGAAGVQEENQAPPLDVTAACVPGRKGTVGRHACQHCGLVSQWPCLSSANLPFLGTLFFSIFSVEV